jgi:hypothetical protein
MVLSCTFFFIYLLYLFINKKHPLILFIWKLFWAFISISLIFSETFLYISRLCNPIAIKWYFLTLSALVYNDRLMARVAAFSIMELNTFSIFLLAILPLAYVNKAYFLFCLHIFNLTALNICILTMIVCCL